MNRESVLGKDPIGRLLLKMAIPTTISMLVGALYQIVDAVFVGQNVGAQGIGAITAVTPLFMFGTSIAIMIATGTASIIARLFGAKKYKELRQTTFNSLSLSLFVNLVITIVYFIFLPQILAVLGIKGETLAYAVEYSRVALFGNFFFSLFLLASALIRSEGKPVFATVSVVTGTIINLCLDAILIIGFNMGMTGAAVATLVGEFVSFALGFGYLFLSKQTIYRLNKTDLKIDIKIVKEIFTIGLPSFVQSFNNSLTEMIANVIILAFGGNMMLAAYGIISRILGFIFLPMFGTVEGSEPIIGYNYGARDLKRVYQAIKTTFWSLFAYSLFIAAAVFIFAKYFFLIFTQEAAVINAGVTPIRVLMTTVAFLIVSLIATSFYQAIGKAKIALFLAIFRQIMILTPSLLILAYVFNMGVWSVWVSYLLSDTLAAIVSWLILRKDLKKMKQKF